MNNLLTPPKAGNWVLVGSVGDITFVGEVTDLVGYDKDLEAWVVKTQDAEGEKIIPVRPPVTPGNAWHFVLHATGLVKVGEVVLQTQDAVDLG